MLPVLNLDNDVHRPVKALPFDLATAVRSPDWRRGFAWPVSYPVLRNLQMGTSTSILDLIGGMTDPRARHLALLCQGPLGALVRTLGELGLLAEAAEKQGIAFSGTPPEWEEVRGGQIAAPDNGVTRPVLGKEQEIGFRFARQLARIASWTKSPVRLAMAAIAPTHTAISHNQLLCRVAAQTDAPIGFDHGDSILLEARKGAAATPDHALVAAVADAFGGLIARTYPLQPEMVQRLLAAYRPRASRIVIAAAGDMEALHRLRRLPQSIWAGSGSPYPIRAVLLEARRRGSTVTSFDHGGTMSMIHDPDSFVLGELTVADRHVVPTQGCVEAISRTGAVERVRLLGGATLAGAQGDPTFRPRSGRAARAPRARPKVYYMATIFRGLRQHLPPYLPDPVYLDWQLRFVSQLNRLSIDLVCKPHPEGLLRGQPHPLEKFAAVEYRRFEEVMDDADVFLYDVSQSTTFWEAVCTDKPVVLVDLGHTKFNATAAPLLERRCRILTAQWDENNLPQIDPKALEAAICDRSSRVDPGELRTLLAGV